MWGNGMKTKHKEKVNKFFQAEQFMKTKSMDMDHIYGPMVKNMKEIGKKIKDMEMDHRSGKKEQNMRESGRKTKDMDKELATIQEARAAFPADQNFRNDELNYYMLSGKQDELVKKLEVESAKDPNNAELLFSLAIVYNGLANPKTGERPANRADLMSKAGDAYQKALKLTPENPELNYNYGAMFNNEAKDINDQMNAITGISDKDTKKYNELKAKRDAIFEMALPYVEKAYTLLDARASSLKGSEKNAYTGSMMVLSQIYSIQNKMDKYNEVKKKMNAK